MRISRRFVCRRPIGTLRSERRSWINLADRRTLAIPSTTSQGANSTLTLWLNVLGTTSRLGSHRQRRREGKAGTCFFWNVVSDLRYCMWPPPRADGGRCYEKLSEILMTAVIHALSGGRTVGLVVLTALRVSMLRSAKRRTRHLAPWLLDSNPRVVAFSPSIRLDV